MPAEGLLVVLTVSGTMCMRLVEGERVLDAEWRF